MLLEKEKLALEAVKFHREFELIVRDDVKDPNLMFSQYKHKYLKGKKAFDSFYRYYRLGLIPAASYTDDTFRILPMNLYLFNNKKSLFEHKASLESRCFVLGNDLLDRQASLWYYNHKRNNHDVAR